MVKSDGKTEKIPAVPGEDIETLEGVFFKSVGKKMLINFHNNTGRILLSYCIIILYCISQ